jgi:hypothetical protein
MPANVMWMLAALLICISGTARGGPVVYNIVNATDAVESVTGIITTNGKFGALEPSDISSWAFQARGLLDFTISSSAETVLFCGVACGWTATAELLLSEIDTGAFATFGVVAGPNTREISFGSDGIVVSTGVVRLRS